MENKQLLSILKDLREKERGLRNITKKQDADGRITYSGPDVINFKLDVPSGLVIVLHYKQIVDARALQNAKEIDATLEGYVKSHPEAEPVYKTWKSKKYDYPYLEQLVNLLKEYDFSDYQSKEDEYTFANWVNTSYFFQDLVAVFPSDEVVALNTIKNCQKQLGVELNHGRVLVNVAETILLLAILKSRAEYVKYTLFDCHSSTKALLTIETFLFDTFKNVSMLDNNDKNAFVPEGEEYDGVILQMKDSTSLSKSKVMNCVRDGGFAIVFDHKTNFNDEDFNKYEIPVMFDANSNCILVRKVKDETEVVRYGSYQVDGFGLYEDAITEGLTNCIKGGASTSSYQELQKEDFRNNRSLDFYKVRRQQDQINFVWRAKEDVYSFLEDQEEWLDDHRVDDDKIINRGSLSSDPFRITIPKTFYLHGFENKYGDEPSILTECKINRVSRYHYTYSIPGKYAKVFRDNYDWDHKIETDEQKMFDKYLCCRVLKTKALLYDGSTGILRVNASKDSPVCFKKYEFYFDEADVNIQCSVVCDAIKINEEYDENFIIHQLLTQKDPLNSTHILVAPTKEEQHTYFLSKRLDYIGKIQPAIDEMEQEVRNSIAESPACITGIGLKNFRRFTDLETVPFAGVNIFVGGNNAGKSTLVKGMLLAVDNLKKLVVDNEDNSLIAPKFQFAANGQHDVHVGTFNRAFSYNAKVDENDPKRRCMAFTLSCAHFDISLSLVPNDGSDSPVVPIGEIKVYDRKRDAEFCFNYEEAYSSAKLKIGQETIDYKRSGFTVSTPKLGEHLISMMIRSFNITNESQLSLLGETEQYDKLKGKAGFILEIADELERVLKNVKVEYIYAHGITQKVLFNYNDKNDFMAQALHDWMAINAGQVEHEFICKWLKEFGIGTDFDISTIGGEAYIIQIKRENGRMTYLADMGMGANQLVILLLRLAVIIHRQRLNEDSLYRPTIVIEEPEQNMHPEFQSKLAVLFYELNKNYGFNFIVETHSEYLVRRSQVIVAQQKYANDEEMGNNNPFKVYYFPSNGKPYEMIYRTDGNFSNEFGKGFYDEANNLLFEII